MKSKIAVITLLLGCSQVSNGLITGSQSRTRSLTHDIITSSAASSESKTTLASSKEDDVLYSFGAEVVPEGQRPVNEYLDMKRAPLFGWGSNEVGIEGLLKRLGVVYAIVFFAM